MTDLDPQTAEADLRASAAHLLSRLREGVSQPDLADACDWLERSLTSDPLVQYRLGTLTPGTLVLVWPTKKLADSEASAFVRDLTRAMGGQFNGAVFTDPDLRVEELDDDTLERLRLAKMSPQVWKAWESLIGAVVDVATEGDTFHTGVALDKAASELSKTMVAGVRDTVQRLPGKQ